MLFPESIYRSWRLNSIICGICYIQTKQEPVSVIEKRKYCLNFIKERSQASWIPLLQYVVYLMNKPKTEGSPFLTTQRRPKPEANHSNVGCSNKDAHIQNLEVYVPWIRVGSTLYLVVGWIFNFCHNNQAAL
jgi:hypothetical protein